MRVGYFNRRILIELENIVRRSINLLPYLFWLFLDPKKFTLIKKEEIKNILVTYSGATGDTYNVLGILNKIKTTYPETNLYYLTTEKNRKFVKNPEIKLINEERAVKLLKSKKIDTAVVLDLVYKEKLYPFLLKPKYVISNNFISISDFFKVPPVFSTRRIFPTNINDVLHQIRCFECLGLDINRKLDFYFPRDAEKFAEKFYKKKINKNEKVIFMHVSGGKIVRCLKEKKVPSPIWPIENWAELANILMKKYKCKLILTGNDEEKSVVNQVYSKIINKTQAINLCGKTSLEQIASLLKRANLLITLDTSIAHIGGQVDVPVIDLIGSYDPRLGFPWTEKRVMLHHYEVCGGCRKYSCPEGNNICMKSISVKEVLKAVSSFL